MKSRSFFITGLLFCSFLFCQNVFTQTTAFTYQGSLKDGTTPANGSYDFEFHVYTGCGAGGAELVPGILVNNVTVTNGIFSVNLDFGSQFFPGADRCLGIKVRQSGSGGGFTPLVPRQPIGSTPYSIKTLNAESAATVGGQPAANVASATQMVTAATSTNTPNSLVRRDVNGDVSANIVNAASQFSLNGNRMIGVFGNNNLFVGLNAGNLTMTGFGNSFFGNSAGEANTSGERNLFVGTLAGYSNTTGFANSFVGAFAGGANTAGKGNSFFGESTGVSNTTGDLNSFFGTAAGYSNTTGKDNAFFGSNAGQANTTANDNSFFGRDAGFNTTEGSSNAFFGRDAGRANINGGENSFFGTFAGQGNIASSNSFFGYSAGSNSTGTGNSFFGRNAGHNNGNGSNNSFFGRSAGSSTGPGSDLTLIGSNANVGSGGLTFATALGAGTTVNASNTVVLGRSLDTVQVPGNLNVAGTFSGNINGSGITNLNATNITSGTLNNARLGVVPVSNGGTGSAAQNFVDLTTAQTIGGDKTFSNNLSSNNLSGNTVHATTQYSLGGAGRVLSAGGINNIFVGNNAGFNQSGHDNSFVGKSAGLSNFGGHSNSYFGAHAGLSNQNGIENSLFGIYAGHASTGSNNSFFGKDAGASNAGGSNNTLIGSNANVGSGNLTNATALGANAVVSANDSVVLGNNANVGIGTSTPLARLDVRGDVFVGLTAQPAFGTTGNSLFIANNNGDPLNSFRLDGAANNLYIIANSGAGASTGAGLIFRTSEAGGFELDRMSIDRNGNVRINVLAGAGSTQLCRNDLNQISTCSSSLRYKSNIANFDPGLSLIKQLRPVSFSWKDAGTPDVGFVAEEVAAVEPLLTTTNAKGEIEGVKYDRVGVVLVNAVQEQQTQIDEQKKIIDGLRAELENQAKELRELKKLIFAKRDGRDLPGEKSLRRK